MTHMFYGDDRHVAEIKAEALNIDELIFNKVSQTQTETVKMCLAQDMPVFVCEILCPLAPDTFCCVT